MRARDPLIALEDVLAAGASIGRFMEGRSLADYEADPMLRSAVERQYEIIGEALSRALRVAPGLAERIPESQGAIGFRNVLAHGYDEIVDRLVFSTTHETLPGLLDRVKAILDDEESPS
jgi:uncharacterized protein with HEPN domain